MTTTNAMSHDVSIVPKGRLALWILIAGEIAIFGGLIATYVLLRFRYPEWAEQTAHTSTPLGALNTFVLLSSSYTIVLAHAYAAKKEFNKAFYLMLITVICGFIFLGVKAIEYTHEISLGLTLTSPKLVAEGKGIGSLFWTFYYTMTGLHATHVIVGMTIISIVMFQVKKGKNLHRVELVGLYWHMVDIIWIFIFPMLYIAK